MTDYISTRGQAPRLGFADAALAGLAADGGLYVPEKLPLFAPLDLEAIAGEPYAQTARRVMSPLTDDVATGAMIDASLASFAHPDIAPLRRLSDRLYVLELFHGPTFAFKDVALQFLGRLFDTLLAARGRRATIVGATSGDTGSAAIEAFRRSRHADIVILHPKGRTSGIQRRQMTTVDAPNVLNIAVEGSFDDCQAMVKAMFADEKFRVDMQLSAVNSINWARIMAQAVYYLHAGARVFAQTGKPPAFAVPTGNFGNVYAGYVARGMGLPVDRLLVCSNANDILYRFFMTGRMQRAAVVPSLSPSMDIQVSSNFERLLFDILGRDGAAVSETMAHFAAGGAFDIDDGAMTVLRGTFSAARRDDAGTLAEIAATLKEFDYLPDPHTAVGMAGARDYLAARPDGVAVVLATAHPAKFPDAVMAATGRMPDMPPALAALEGLPEKYDTLPADLARVQARIRAAFAR